MTTPLLKSAKILKSLRDLEACCHLDSVKNLQRVEKLQDKLLNLFVNKKKRTCHL